MLKDLLINRFTLYIVFAEVFFILAWGLGLASPLFLVFPPLGWIIASFVGRNNV